MNREISKNVNKRATKRPATAAVMKIQTKSPRKGIHFDISNDIFSQIKIRPKTRSEVLRLKDWRAKKFHGGATASKREVKLLGEWLNSVLAENLEDTENPIDVVTNAQHWYSVAFNELVRQVSVCCAERGRLFAVIWKRNQDLFTKMIELQKQEREYILKCHKERVQFLKTDLEFSGSRYKTIRDAYEKELARWKESSACDITKFDSLQQKINQQMEERTRLMKEVNSYKKKLNIPFTTEIKKEESLVNVYTYEDLCTILREVHVSLMDKDKVKLESVNSALDSIDFYLTHDAKASLSYRNRFDYCFLSIPNTEVPRLRKINWLKAAISFLYTNYMAALGRIGPAKMMKKPLVDFCLETFISLFGSRQRAERTLLDLIATAMNNVNSDDASSRVTSFIAFLGLKNPFSLDAFHFYLFALATLLKNNAGPLFPEVETTDSTVCAVPQAAIIEASNYVLGKLVSDKTLKFYIQRIEKVANSGTLRFGGRQIAELDEILDYILTFYNEETKNFEDNLSDVWKSFGITEIETFTQFRQVMLKIIGSTESNKLSSMYTEQLKNKKDMKIDFSDIITILWENDLLIPIKLTADSFPRDPSIEDMTQFIQQEFSEILPVYDKTLERLFMYGDEIQAKSLKAAKIKYEQSISGHCTAKIFLSNIRDFFEKLDLANNI